MYMKRKIIKLGQATFVASLPSKWIRKYQLKQGDYLELEEKENSVVLSTEKLIENKRIVIELPTKEFFMKRLVYVPYRFGYDEIKFIYKDPSLLKKLQEAAQILMGFEIVEQGEQYCVFRNISSSFEDEFENIFKRVFLIIINLMKDFTDIMKKEEFKRFNNLEGNDVVIDKMACFCERVINKRGSADFMKNSLLYITAWTLRQIGTDVAKDLRLIFSKLTKVSNITISSFEETLSFFELLFQMYYKPSLDGLLKFSKKYSELDKKLKKSLIDVGDNEKEIISYLLLITDKINHVGLSLRLKQEVK